MNDAFLISVPFHYCFDVLDSPTGNDDTLRPNQHPPLLTPNQQKQVVEVCAAHLLISHGLRSLSPTDPHYQGHYGGDQTYRDAAYHQGTVWAWLLGSFTLAHYAVFQDKAQANQFLKPIAHHLTTAGLGTISKIFNGDAPMQPKGCIAQAWSVGELLRVWLAINNETQ